MSGSANYEAGSIGFRIQAIGAEVFKRDLDAAEKSVENLGKASQESATKVAPLSKEIDKTTKSSKETKAPVESAAQATKRLAAEAAAAAAKVKAAAVEVERLKRESDAAARTIGTAAVGVGAAFAAVALLTVSTYAKFDEANSKTAAATMATKEQQDQLKDSAIEQGAASVYSAKEAADAQTELAKAGVSVNDILGGGLKGSLALAAAGELAVARAAEIAATTLTVFGLKGDQAGHVADLLAAGAGKAQGSVEDLSLGLGYVGVSFAQLNIPLEDTVGTLALLAANGLLGEKAGTGLRSVMSSLTAPVAKGAAAMKQYNIDVFDGQGKFIGMAGAAEQLKQGLGGLDEQTRSAAMGAIFGAEAATAAGILYKEGAEGVEEWTNNVDDQGYAAEQAAMKTDNLMGDLERLGGSLDSALIKTGSTANDTLREMVQILTGLTDWYGSLDESAQGTVLTVGATTAAVLILGGTFMLAVPKIVEFRLALTALNTNMKGTAIAGGAVGLAITAVVVIMGALAAQNASAAQSAAAFTDTLDAQTGALTKNTRAAIVKELQDKGLFEFAKKAGISQSELTDAVYKGGDALKDVTDRFSELNTVTNLWGDTNAFAAGNAQSALRGVTEGLELSKDAWANETAATDRASDSADGAVGSYVEVEDAVDGVVTSITDLITELDALNGKNLDSREAARALEEAYDSFDESVKENGTTLDTTTEAGRANEAALDDIAQAAMDSGQAIVDSGGSYDDYRASLDGSRDALLLRIGDLGISGQAAQDLADKILKIPSETEWTAYISTAEAQAKLDALATSAARVARAISNVAQGATGAPGQGMGFLKPEADGGVLSFYANGGVRENHVAQIAQAGTMRVWAEPETEGEGYIPLAQSKRGRSTAVLADIAGKFGYQLVPAGAQAFAGGGVVGGAAAPAAGITWTGDIVIPGHTGDDKHLAVLVRRELQDLIRGGAV